MPAGPAGRTAHRRRSTRCSHPRATRSRWCLWISGPPEGAGTRWVRGRFRPAGIRSCCCGAPRAARWWWRTLCGCGSSPTRSSGGVERLLLVERGELLLQVSQLRHVVEDDVRLVGVAREIVLVILLRGIEALERRHLGDDGTGEDAGLVQLLDVGLRRLLFTLAGVEDRLTVLAPHIRTLAVQLGRIVRHGEEHPQQLTI